MILYIYIIYCFVPINNQAIKQASNQIKQFDIYIYIIRLIFYYIYDNGNESSTFPIIKHVVFKQVLL